MIHNATINMCSVKVVWVKFILSNDKGSAVSDMTVFPIHIKVGMRKMNSAELKVKAQKKNSHKDKEKANDVESSA